MTHRTLRALWFLAALATAAASSFAQADAARDAANPDPIPALAGRPDVLGEELLGGTFQNPVAGIAFRTPAGCTQVKASADQIARFTNEKSGWEVICTRNSSDRPMPLAGRAVGQPLATTRNASKAEAEKVVELNKVGLLDVVAARLKQTNPGIEIVRQDVEDLGEQKAGLLVARASGVGQRKLFQQAIIQANDQLYYTLTLTTPAAKDAKGADSEDAGEKIAAETFKQMLETVKLLDRGPVKDDQNQRLYRTRALFTTFTPKKLHDTLIPEQWMRLIHEGKDIGYTYVVEEPDVAGKVEGIKIGVRSRSYPDADTQVDGETWFIASSDRRHENWSNLVWIQNLKKKTADQLVEIGSSDRVTRRQAEPGAQLVNPDGGKDPKVAIYDTYELNVQTVAKSGSAEPVKRSLPPFYIPQAIGHLLPRLLPTREPKTFLFATYVGDRREVMLRYVDVGSEQEVDLAGRRVRAIPITDRLGIEGSPTIHYVDPASNKYLGSVNEDSKITVLPADKEFLQKKWSNADLSRPRAPKAGDLPKSTETGSIK
jgi:hypothetical protein